MVCADTESLIDCTVYSDAVLNGTAGKLTANPGIRTKKIPLKFDIETLDMLAAYAYEESPYITRAALINLKSLIEMCNMSLYKNNQSLKARIDFIKLVLDAKLQNGLNNRKLIISYIMERVEQKELTREEILPELIKIKLNHRAIQHLNGFIADRLIYGFMYSYKTEIFQVYEDMESGNFSSLRNLAVKYKALISDLLHDIRTSEAFTDNQMTFDLSDGNFENVVAQMVTKLKAPGNKLKTGSQAMNEMLGGGFECGRAYLFFGLPGIGKSIVLLNMCEWLRVHNRLKPKDSSKRCAILYITQENSLAETVERLFNMTVTGDDIREYTPAEVIQLLRTKGNLMLKDKDDIDFIVKYYDDKEISTIDLYSIIEDIEDTGREVVALIHDYIERIRSSINHPEIRLELAAVANDYTVLAKRLNIPVIGAGQISRKGSDIIDSAMEANKADLVRSFGRSVISEAWGMLKNLDGAYFIHREFDSAMNEFITFFDIKHRARKDRKKKRFENYMAHPLDPDNGIKLLDDIHLDIPLSRTTLNDATKELEILKRNQSLRDKQDMKNNTTNTEEIDTDNIIDFKFLGDALKRRKKVDKLDTIDESKLESKFNGLINKYIEFDTDYTRNDNGYIKLIRRKKQSIKVIRKAVNG